MYDINVNFSKVFICSSLTHCQGIYVVFISLPAVVTHFNVSVNRLYGNVLTATGIILFCVLFV